MAKFSPQKFLAQVGNGKTTLTCPKNRILFFRKGNTADAAFYIRTGQVKLTVISSQGKEAIVAMLEPRAFLGEGCLAGQLVCMATAAATERSTIVRIDKEAMIRVLHDEPAFSELFLAYLLSRNIHPRELGGSAVQFQ
jgi:CRP/FNR family transcriptional regulator, cyclic AMP receptor protein